MKRYNIKNKVKYNIRNAEVIQLLLMERNSMWITVPSVCQSLNLYNLYFFQNVGDRSNCDLLHTGVCLTSSRVFPLPFPVLFVTSSQAGYNNQTCKISSYNTNILWNRPNNFSINSKAFSQRRA